MKVYCKHAELVSVKDLKPHPENPNKHDKRNIEELAYVIKANGWRYPVVVSNQSGLINTGHARVEAAKLNKWDKVPVDYQDFPSDADEIANMIADNKLQELSESDDIKIQELALDLGPDFDNRRFGIPDFKVKGIDTLPPREKELDENIETEKECPSCGYKW